MTTTLETTAPAAPLLGTTFPTRPATWPCS